jgi:hypothetical protein
MLEKITSLEQAKSKITKETMDTLHLGSLMIGDTHDPSYEIMEWMFNEILPPLKIFKWGDTLQLRKDKKFKGFNGLRNKSLPYHRFLHHGHTSLKMEGNHAGFGFLINGEESNITDVVYNIRPEEKNDPQMMETLGSCYYHGAKAHWLTQSIIEEGLWAPIQGYTDNPYGDVMELVIHPGSVRSCIFEEMEDDDMECMIWDKTGQLEDFPNTSFQEVLDYWGRKLGERDRHKNLSFLLCRGVIEWQTDLAELGFRDDVFKFNKKVYDLSAGKPLTIYIGYDSTMNDLEQVCEKSIRATIQDAHSRGYGEEYMKYSPTIKMLDISKLPDYNREYANQSTEFTYSRFLIPHLENYEGFSLFVDNDFIFTKSLLPMFYYLNPDDAVACIKYPHYEHDATKFDGEVNIDYPCKLWSSMMFFNNSHEDCKKLTPEVVNTWTGKQLHQFEWTDAISEIPQKYIFVEGYDNPEEKWDYTGIHYTRGGPWIDGMDFGSINNLEVYNKYKNI